MNFNEMVSKYKKMIENGEIGAAINLVADYADNNGWGPAEEEAFEEVQS